MSYLDDFKARITASGNTIGESQFNTTAAFIESTFADSPFYRVVQVNGHDVEIRLMDITSVTRSNAVSLVQYQLKFAMLKPNTSLNIGDLIEMEDSTWMVTDYTGENPLFPKAKIEQCTYLLNVKTGQTKTLKGHDNLNRPVYDIVPVYSTVQSLIRTAVTSIGLNQPINLPSGQVSITIKYDDTAKIIKENDEFEIYNRQYKVIGFDFTNIVQGVGVLVIIAERMVNT